MRELCHRDNEEEVEEQLDRLTAVLAVVLVKSATSVLAKTRVDFDSRLSCEQSLSSTPSGIHVGSLLQTRARKMHLPEPSPPSAPASDITKENPLS